MLYVAQLSAVRRALLTGNDFDIEYRTIWPNGETQWVYIRGGRTSRPDGKVIRLTGVSLDITARKTAEADLRQLNENLETRIAERTAQLSYFRDPLP